MRSSVNLLSDAAPASLGKDMDAISESRRTRSSEADFDSYLDFLEQTASMFGFEKKEKAHSVKNPKSPCRPIMFT